MTDQEPVPPDAEADRVMQNAELEVKLGKMCDEASITIAQIFSHITNADFPRADRYEIVGRELRALLGTVTEALEAIEQWGGGDA